MLASAWLCALLAGAPAMASDFFEHKDWRVFTDVTAAGEKLCVAMTGGDGDNALTLSANTTGDIGIEYAEATARGYSTQLGRDDVVRLVVRGPAPITFEDVAVESGVDQDGIPFALIGLVGGDVASAIASMRAGNTLEVVRDGSGGEELIHRFSLSGFTAAFLKVAEWCGFSPDVVNRS